MPVLAGQRLSPLAFVVAEHETGKFSGRCKPLQRCSLYISPVRVTTLHLIGDGGTIRPSLTRIPRERGQVPCSEMHARVPKQRLGQKAHALSLRSGKADWPVS